MQARGALGGGAVALAPAWPDGGYGHASPQWPCRQRTHEDASAAAQHQRTHLAGLRLPRAAGTDIGRRRTAAGIDIGRRRAAAGLASCCKRGGRGRSGGRNQRGGHASRAGRSGRGGRGGRSGRQLQGRELLQGWHGILEDRLVLLGRARELEAKPAEPQRTPLAVHLLWLVRRGRRQPQRRGVTRRSVTRSGGGGGEACLEQHVRQQRGACARAGACAPLRECPPECRQPPRRGRRVLEEHIEAIGAANAAGTGTANAANATAATQMGIDTRAGQPRVHQHRSPHCARPHSTLRRPAADQAQQQLCGAAARDQRHLAHSTRHELVQRACSRLPHRPECTHRAALHVKGGGCARCIHEWREVEHNDRRRCVVVRSIVIAQHCLLRYDCELGERMHGICWVLGKPQYDSSAPGGEQGARTHVSIPDVRHPVARGGPGIFFLRAKPRAGMQRAHRARPSAGGGPAGRRSQRKDDADLYRILYLYLTEAHLSYLITSGTGWLAGAGSDSVILHVQAWFLMCMCMCMCMYTPHSTLVASVHS